MEYLDLTRDGRADPPFVLVIGRDQTLIKLIESAQRRWRAVNAPRLVALVPARARFDKDVLVERERFAAA